MGNSSTKPDKTNGTCENRPSISTKSLLRAAFVGNTNELRRALNDNKYIINYQDQWGFTALMAAASGGRTEAVQILLGCGADTDLTDNNGVTAMMCAVQRGHIDVVDLLLDAGARTDLCDMEGCNVFMCAARAGHMHVVTLLMEHSQTRPQTAQSPSKHAQTASNAASPESTSRFGQLKAQLSRRLTLSQQCSAKTNNHETDPKREGTGGGKKEGVQMLMDSHDVIYVFSL